MNELIKVLLADDHPMFLEGVKNALQKFPQLQIVAECTDGNAVTDYLSGFAIDVAVLDINMPGQSGIELAKFINKEFPHTKVVFLTMYHPSNLGNDSFTSPYTHGYVLKNSGSQVLYEAIICAYTGGRYIDPKLSGYIADPKSNLVPRVKLSSREKEIIKLVVEGKGNKEIASQLFLSELTIKTHRKNVYQKLEVNNVAGMLQSLRKLGISLDE